MNGCYYSANRGFAKIVALGIGIPRWMDAVWFFGVTHHNILLHLSKTPKNTSQFKLLIATIHIHCTNSYTLMQLPFLTLQVNHAIRKSETERRARSKRGQELKRWKRTKLQSGGIKAKYTKIFARVLISSRLNTKNFARALLYLEGTIQRSSQDLWQPWPSGEKFHTAFLIPRTEQFERSVQLFWYSGQK